MPVFSDYTKYTAEWAMDAEKRVENLERYNCGLAQESCKKDDRIAELETLLKHTRGLCVSSEAEAKEYAEIKAEVERLRELYEAHQAIDGNMWSAGEGWARYESAPMTVQGSDTAGVVMSESVTIACRKCYGLGKLYTPIKTETTKKVTQICPDCKGSKGATIQRRKTGSGDTARGGE